MKKDNSYYDDFLPSKFGKWLSTPPPGDEVVITGMAGRFPDSDSVYEFATHLQNKESMISNDSRRWTPVAHPELPPQSGRIYTVDKFDTGYFGFHYRQSHTMDPTLRILMETGIEAIMDAGIHPSELEGTKTGIYIGTTCSDIEKVTLNNITKPQNFGITGYLRSMLPNRLSYHLKLKGPSIAVDTACSSSLNALEHAFKDIRTGKCENALVGCATLILHPGSTIQFFRLGVLSPEGVPKVFDEKADGYVRSETVGCLLLQKRKNARRIYAKVLHAKVNCDGYKKEGITFPSVEMQCQLLKEIYDDCRIKASDLSFIEAHATGTKVGDPQELQAVDEALAKNRQEPLWIGSVKSSIGHTEVSSGVASVVKVLIAMESGFVSPNINLTELRKGIEAFQSGRLKVLIEKLPLDDDQAIIAINNFGFGGNNCHAVVQRNHKTKSNSNFPKDDLPRLVCVSGRTEEAVKTILNDLNSRDFDPEYVALYHQLFKRDFSTHLYRGFTILAKSGPVLTKFQFYPRETSPFYVVFGNFQKHYKAAAKSLMDFPPFKSSLARINNILSMDNIDTFDVISKGTHQNGNDIMGAMVVQICISDLVKILDLKPKYIYWDSFGKVICDYLNGGTTLKQICDFAKSKAKILNSNDFEIPNNGLVFNVSDRNFKSSFQNAIFLELIGDLYIHGHEPQLHNLYPKIDYPVSRGTPMISPVIKWQHDSIWKTYKFTNFEIVGLEQKEYSLNLEHEEYKFLSGHVVDGRNLYPATGYLYLVWYTLARCRNVLPLDMSVVFENCKFIRAVKVPPKGYFKLTVSLQMGKRNFKVLEGGSCIVSGRAFLVDNNTKYQPDEFEIVESNSSKTLTQDEIYRELNLRGYNYSGSFKGLINCNVTATTGLVKWENNWVTFLDNILQMKILQTDTRLLYVPTGIRRLVVDITKHKTTIADLETVNIPVHVSKITDIIRAGGVEIQGLSAFSIGRRKLTAEPVLEKYQFIPNRTFLNLNDSLRVDTQIILENSLESTVKAVELIDDFTKNTSKPLLPLISEILGDVPLVKPNLTISSKTPIDDAASIKTEDVVLTPQSNFLWILGSKLLQRQVILQQAINALKENGFILTREEKDFYPNNYEEIHVITQHTLDEEKLILLRRKNEILEPTVIEVSSQNFDWLPLLQTAIKTENNVLIYSQNQPLDGILGLINCIRREPEGSKVKCFFMVDEAPTFNLRDTFYKDQIEKGFAINIYKNGEWGTYRHLLLQEDTNEVEREHCYVNVTTTGNLSSLRWLEGPLTLNSKLSEDKILINVYYATLNFRDIMTATGRLNADVVTTNRLEQQCTLGFEFSGRDLSGKRLMGSLLGGACATLVAADPYLTFPVPDDWSLEDAATVPAVYLTVIYALLMRIKLVPGSSILIHSGTGGIGLVAINIALHFKCDVYTTVGSKEKRDFLKNQFPQLQDDHIGNSRDLSFENMVKKGTNGKGVDVVLNSLVGDKIMASISCLAFGGNFMEIGKFELVKNTDLDLLLMEKKVNFHGIMLDDVFRQGSQVKLYFASIFHQYLKEGLIKPLPRTVFKNDEIESAFRHMTSGKHVGKVMIQIRDEEKGSHIITQKRIFPCIPRFYCHSDKVQIIIGGLGGIGLELADWMVLRGAKQLVLVSRTGLQTGYQNQRISIWKSYGVSVHISTSDITTKSGCLELIKESSKFGQIDGIFNLGVVLKDALFESQTPENFTISFEPKARATQYLDEITRELCPNLRFFVVFSSVACGRGNPGQTNYGMANSIMERICEKRHEDGFPALAIQWGAIGDVGLVAKMQKDNKILEIGGTLQQKISNCFEVLDKMMGQNNVVVSSMVVAEKRSRYDGSAVNAVAHILGIKDLKSVNLDTTLPELGMDSITGTEIFQVLEKDFEIVLKPEEVRTLTFAKLIQIEGENKKGIDNATKMQHGLAQILQHLPNSANCNIPTIKMTTAIDGTVKAPLVFVLPGIEGTLINLEEPIAKLKAHAVALQYNHTDPEKSIAEMAKNMFQHVENEITKDEHFNIFAYSFGTAVAIELATILEDKGYHGRIFAIDGSPQYLSDCLKEMAPAKTEDEFQTAIMYQTLSLVLPMETILQKREKIASFTNYNERIDYSISLTINNDSSKTLEKQAASALYFRLKAILDYEYEHDKLKKTLIHLYKASKPFMTYMDDDFKLSQISQQPIKIKKFEGDHVTILNNNGLIQEINDIIIAESVEKPAN